MLEKSASLVVELVLALEVFARDQKRAQWAPIFSEHVGLQIRRCFVQSLEPFIFESVEDLLLAEVRQFDYV